jgi:hypothetical protein
MTILCADAAVAEAAITSVAGRANITEPTINDKTINFFIIPPLFFYASITRARTDKTVRYSSKLTYSMQTYVKATFSFHTTRGEHEPVRKRRAQGFPL